MNTHNTTLAIRLEMPTGGASDRRLKKDIAPLESSLQKVLALRPVTWYWKDDVKKETMQYGFIAQEVEEVFPEMVTEEKWHDGSDKKFLSAGGMTPHVVEAIKEQHETIIETTEQVTNLIETLQRQQKEIDHLHTLIKENSSRS